MSDTNPTTERQAPSDLVARIAAELRGPGAACLMSGRDSTDAAVDLIDALADAGYVIVPREPTEAMIEAAERAGIYGDSMERVPDAYRDMIATALGETIEYPKTGAAG